MMKIIINKNTNIDKELLIIKTLEYLINEDKINNDPKSLKYHSMALEEHKNVLSKLKNNVGRIL